MEYFKVDQNSWLRYEKTLFCVMFQNMYTWCSLRNEGDFFAFFKMGVFLRSLKIYFFGGSTFNLFLEFKFQFQSLRFWIQNDPLRVPKIDKSNKSSSQQTRGQMNYLRVEQNSWLRYGLNGFCCVLRYVSVMYIQIEEVVFAFFKNWRFLGRVYKFSFWGIKVLIDF